MSKIKPLIKSILFSCLLILLFLEIWVGFPIRLETLEEKPKEQNPIGQEQAEKKAEGVHLLESQAGNRDWELFSEKAESFVGKDEWHLQNVKALFYSNNKVQFVVTGKEGRIDNKSKNLSILGDVVTQSVNGYRFESPSAHYNSSERVLQSPDRVKMIGPKDSKGSGMLLQGLGMRALVDTNLMTIQNEVRAKKQLNDGKLVRIESKQGEFSGKNNSAKFTDDVTIFYNTMKIEGPEAYFQYSEGSDYLQSVLIKGGARVTDVDKTATSESVNFDPNTNQFTLRGLPRVIHSDDEVLGDEIVFINGGKKIKVEKMKAHVNDSE